MAKSPQRTIRMEDVQVWDRFGVEAKRAGTDRSTLLRQFILWYIREGALPPRPAK
jgi:hypothetical protein